MVAQVGGDYTYQFLNLTTSPVQGALGGKNFTNSGDEVSLSFSNPASISKTMNNQLSLNFSRVFNAINYGSAAYVKSFDDHKNLFIGVNYINYGDIEGYDEWGNPVGSFSGNEVALSLGTSYNIERTNWYFGVNAKFIFSNMEIYNSLGAAVDLGVLYKDEDSNIDFAFVIRNLGGQITSYAEHREKMPLDIALALSKKLENVPLRWHVALDNLQKWDLSYSNPNRGEADLEGNRKEEKISVFNNALRHIIVGIELFPDKKFNLRVGYNFRKGEELRIVDQRHFSGFTAGAGFKYNRFKFDYSYARQTVAANTSMFGVSIDLN